MKWYFKIIDLFGVVCILIGIASFVGHIIDKKELYSWQAGAPMALNTAIVIILQGLSTIMIVVHLVRQNTLSKQK